MPLISVIMGVYNTPYEYLEKSINSVLNQTVNNWELLLVNDCSTDKSEEVINKYLGDSRIKLINNEVNSRAAVSRNNGIKQAVGRYICFLDADDKWDKEKLEKQIKFMKEKNCAFSFTSYEFADKDCIPNGKKVIVPEKINYKEALKNTTIWTSTVMFDMDKLSKEDIYMPNVKSEDTACWWKILKKIDYAYGLEDVLSFYRRTEGTLSSNKFEAIKRIWNLYRNVENLNIFVSFYCFCFYAFRAVLRRV